jgi:endoglycosylceramidase
MLALYGRALRDQPFLLGYDIFNEPNAGSQYPTCISPLGCPLFDRQLTAWYRRVVPVLRAADANHLILYEPNVFFDFGANTNLGPPADPNSGFAWHSYCLGDGAAAALPDIPGNSHGCGIEEELELHDATSYGARASVALIADEWGATTDVTTIARQTAEFDGALMPWVFWDYRNLVHDVTRVPAGDNVNQGMLLTLDRPYPQAIAGRPTSWAWDPGRRVFDLGYIPRHGRTDIFVPALQFPLGYRVSAVGGRVVSPPGAHVLSIVATGTSAIHVEVRSR